MFQHKSPFTSGVKQNVLPWCSRNVLWTTTGKNIITDFNGFFLGGTYPWRVLMMGSQGWNDPGGENNSTHAHTPVASADRPRWLCWGRGRAELNCFILIQNTPTESITQTHSHSYKQPCWHTYTHTEGGRAVWEEVKMKVLQPYLAEPTDMSHLCDQGLCPLLLSLSLSHSRKTHLSTDAEAYYQLKCNPPMHSFILFTQSYFGAAEIIDDTLIRNNLLLMLQACDCHHPTHWACLLLEQSGSVCVCVCVCVCSHQGPRRKRKHPAEDDQEVKAKKTKNTINHKDKVYGFKLMSCCHRRDLVCFHLRDKPIKVRTAD